MKNLMAFKIQCQKLKMREFEFNFVDLKLDISCARVIQQQNETNAYFFLSV